MKGNNSKGISKFHEEEKKMVDVIVGSVLYGLGIVLVVLGFVVVLSDAVPKLGFDVSEIIVGAIVFAISVSIFKVRI
jgi:hypothetical protein